MISVEFRQKQRKYLVDVQSQEDGALAEIEIIFGINLNEKENQYGWWMIHMKLFNHTKSKLQKLCKTLKSLVLSLRN